MRVADSSALFAFFVEADPHHAEAVREVARDEPIVVPSEILAETVRVVEHRFDRSAARRALRDILQMPHVQVAEKMHVPAVMAIYEASGHLSLADAFVVQTCIALAAEPITFDRRLAKAVADRRSGG